MGALGRQREVGHGWRRLTNVAGPALIAGMAPDPRLGKVLTRRALSRVIDALLPPQCLACRAPVDRSGQLCAPCWGELAWIEEPLCAACGLPFDFDLGPEALCAACAADHPAYDRARAVLRYDEHSRALVLAFKHADRTQGAPAFGSWMARAGAALIADAEVVAPVPLHRWRLLARRFNQAALLAAAAANGARAQVAPDLLRRLRATPSQGGLSPAQRADNVAGAFAVRRGREPLVEGRRVLLVDDVMTTGATVEACARTLKRAGARAVDVLILARVVRAQG